MEPEPAMALDVAELTIEPSDLVRREPCRCCDDEFASLHGVLFASGDAIAFYMAALWDGRPGTAHPERLAAIIVSVGDWSDDGTGAVRRSASFHVRSTYAGLRTIPTDAATSIW